MEVIKEKVVVIERRKLVYCHDLPGFSNYIKEKRGITQDVEVTQTLQKVGIDGGGMYLPY